MKNPLTVTIESSMAAIMVLLFSVFLIGLLLVAVKNFNTETEVLSAQDYNILRTVSPQERSLINEWLESSDVGLSVEDVGYRFIIKNFPDKPWTR